MTQYRTRIRTDRSVDDVFAYLSDIRNFAEWDPGTKRVVQTAGDGPGLGSRYDVTASGPGRDIVLPYEVIEWSPPNRLAARAEGSSLTSLDRIDLQRDGSHTIVTYEANITLKGLLRLTQPVFGMIFNRIGDKAAAGLATHVNGTIISD